ncbi:DUF2993 domain-containing protein [Micromonospora sp. WMMD882]|uniref:LmeA family phospholipid-binding protein n=1 Tax=Micromonospora sp. WMMD882 TaxID=3015151 RepID=UPI00248A9AAA|nr:DUF2993 domain-containing protein [Micromonospora sp. WMMD882]WBB81227.1 DUF2993 domain-containing protein [Micromonospora sp. WMMD882]
MRWSRNRRRLTALAALLTVTALTAAVVTDRWVARTAAGRLAGRLACVAGLDEPPRVRVHGFPVLPDVLAGRVDRLSAEARDVQRGDLRAARVAATLSEVRLPDDQPARIGGLTLEVQVGFDALPTEVAGRQVRYRAVNGLLGIDTDAAVAGQRLPVTVLARPTVADRRLTVTPTEIEVLGVRRSAGPGIVDRITGGRDLSRPLPDLPEGLTWRGVDVVDDGLRLSLSGHDLTMAATDTGRRGGTCGGA